MSLPVIDAVLALYGDVDTETAAVRAATGLRCPTGCAACCASTEVQATPLEMLPLAWQLAQAHDLEAVIDRAESAPPQCLFHDPAGPVGGCTVYPWRPTLCRLFGFAARRDKHGRVELIVCRVTRTTQPEAAAAARRDVAVGTVVAPLFGDVDRRLAGIEPALAEPRLPINAALAAALRWLWLRRHFGAPPFDQPPTVAPPRAA